MSGYLDDNILVNYETVENALLKGEFAANLFHKLGFTINIPKSVAFPVRIIEHLGILIDSNADLNDWAEDRLNHKAGLGATNAILG